MYVKREVMCKIVQLSTGYCEHRSFAVKFSKENSVFIMSVYRSPNSSVSNNVRLLQLLKEISDASFKYKLVLGDFSLPSPPQTGTTTQQMWVCMDFLLFSFENIGECFFTQHVKDTIQMRENSKGNTLDLLLSNGESIV